MKKMIVTIVMLFALSACGGAGNTYESTGAVINDLNKAGISCSGDGAGETVVGISEDCNGEDANPDPDIYDPVFYTVSIYGSSDQKEEAKEYLTQMNPSTYYVFGENWSVSLDNQSQADKVSNKLGGEVVAPEFPVN